MIIGQGVGVSLKQHNMSTGFPKNGINKGWFKKGSKLPPETVEKIRKKLLCNKYALGTHGGKHSEEAKRKIGEARRGKKRSPFS